MWTSKNKILVGGDSGAILDKTHGHWAKIWADKNNYEADFCGDVGSGHVVNVTKMMDYDFSDYNFLIYFSGDFLASTTTFENIDFSSTDNFVEHLSNRKTLFKKLAYVDPKSTTKNDFKWLMNNSFNTQITMSLEPEDFNKTFKNHLLKSTDVFYSVSNLQHVLQSNYFALLSLIQHANILNKKLFIVDNHDQLNYVLLNNGRSYHNNNLFFNLGNMRMYPNHHPNDSDMEKSINQTSKTNHKILFRKFSKFLSMTDNV